MQTFFLEKKDSLTLYKMLISGLFIKMLIFCFVNYYLENNSDGFAFYDDYDYHHVSKQMSENWKQGDFYNPKEIKYQAEKNPGYYYLVSFKFGLRFFPN